MNNIKDLINQRRSQMLVHSYLYYGLDESIVDDQTFDKWARELVKLQDDYPDVASKCIYAGNFKEFDGTTGFHLPRDLWVRTKALRLLNYHKKHQNI